MVNLTRIYTRTGDDGTTGLGDFSRTSKNDPRLIAYADVDEANSAIGVVLAMAAPDLGEPLTALLRRVQNDLFDVGADLCTPLSVIAPKHPPLRVTAEYITRLEEACDTWNAELPALRSFILPGGSPGSAFLHVARTVTRRAERAVWAAIDAHGTEPDGGVNPLTAQYLNRLSDLLFILGRVANGEAGDVLWVPGG
jgi:cob(I)alamin adenosyltransferase